MDAAREAALARGAGCAIRGAASAERLSAAPRGRRGVGAASAVRAGAARAARARRRLRPLIRALRPEARRARAAVVVPRALEVEDGGVWLARRGCSTGRWGLGEL